jgi:hypothetical protein
VIPDPGNVLPERIYEKVFWRNVYETGYLENEKMIKGVKIS